MALYSHTQEIKEYPLQDFGPDLALNASSRGQIVLIDMHGGIPTVKGYQAMNRPEPLFRPALPSPPLGATVVYYSNNRVQLFVGDANHLYYLPGTGQNDPLIGAVTEPTITEVFTWAIAENPGAIPTPVSHPWRFAQFGDFVMAVNQDQVQPLVSNNDPTGHFAPLAGNPPANAALVTAVNGQGLMFEGSNWHASALATILDWTPDIQTQAGAGPITDSPGTLTAVARIFRNVVLFKPTATWLGTYVGGQAVWSWQLISDLTGTFGQGCVVEMPDSVAFLGIDDFYVTSGYTPQRIPNSLKEWFFDVVDITQLDKVQSRYDPFRALVFWHFVSKATPRFATPDRYVVWNSRTGRWGAGYLNATVFPQPNFQPGYNPGARMLSTGLWTGAFFGLDEVLYSFTGLPGNAMYRTNFVGNPQNLTQVMRVKPLYYVGPNDSTLQPYHIRNLGDRQIAGPASFLSPDGWFMFRQYDGWHSFQLNTNGGNGAPQLPDMLHGAEISSLLIDMRQGGWR